jgi:hypothetical protein
MSSEQLHGEPDAGEARAATWLMRKPVTSASRLVLKGQDTALRPGQVPLAPQPTRS